ncbi:HD1 homeodomain mating-type protein Le.a1-3 [Lentinula aff. lateritia]|uniref:HD1 homeodomain mating-type protein Le.a1-3 n=1 Tax=Lentinula aff. lateritia TaxID=2804960 RepID=A0ACC1TM63_9AGAR|nr:HD1 homeodomain mating-type protein Le.a1-3 [Lentinula aff. lateritia]
MASMKNIDDLLRSSVDEFFDSLQKADFTASITSWQTLHHDVDSGRGALDAETSALGLGFTQCIEKLCDTFINLEVKTNDLTTRLREDLVDSTLEKELQNTPSRSPSPSLATRSPSPSSQLSSGNLPSYIPPSYTWLLSNLHNPYPSTSIRDSIASSTNTPRRLIDAWFVDVRRRIGWTNLIEGRSGLKGGGAKTHGKGTPGVRRPHKTLGPPPNPINNFVNGITEVPKYKTRKELVAAATRFFVRPAVSVGGPELGLAYSANANDLSASENQTFTVMADTARMLYREKLHPTELAVAVTSRVKQWTPGLGEMAKEVREEERRRKRSRGVKREEEEEEDEEEYTSDGKKRKRYLSPSDSSTPSSSAPPTPTDATFPTPTPTANLKRKRTVSFADPSSSSFPAVSPSTKRLRTALNSAALSRSVSDPTPMPASQQQQAQIHTPPPPLTFSGFPAPILDSWFTTLTAPSPPPEGLALEKGFGNQWMDPLFFGFPDPVMRSDDAAGVLGDGKVYFDPRNSVDVTVPDLRTAFPGLSSLYGRTASASSLNSSFTSSSSSPSTPALSASGSLTEEEYEERYVDGDGDRERDSLFGDEDGDTEERERGVGAKALTPGDILNGGNNHNNNNNNSSSTTSTNIFPDFPPTAHAHPNSGSNLQTLPTLPDLSSLSSLPDLSSLSSLPTFPTFPAFPTFPNPSSSSFDTFDFSSFPSLPEFNLDAGFPEFLQGTQTQTQGGLDGDSGFGSNVNVDFGLGFGVGADAGNGDVDVDSFVAMIQAQAQSQSQDQPRDQDATQTQVPWAGPTPTRERFAISTSV